MLYQSDDGPDIRLLILMTYGLARRRTLQESRNPRKCLLRRLDRYSLTQCSATFRLEQRRFLVLGWHHLEEPHPERFVAGQEQPGVWLGQLSWMLVRGRVTPLRHLQKENQSTPLRTDVDDLDLPPSKSKGFLDTTDILNSYPLNRISGGICILKKWLVIMIGETKRNTEA